MSVELQKHSNFFKQYIVSCLNRKLTTFRFRLSRILRLFIGKKLNQKVSLFDQFKHRFYEKSVSRFLSDEAQLKLVNC